MILATKGRLFHHIESVLSPALPHCQDLLRAAVRWFWCIVFFIFFFAMITKPAAAAQSSAEIKALQNQLEALQADQAALEKEVQEIKAMLRRMLNPSQPPHSGNAGAAVLDLKGRPARGAPSAPVTIVEFSDYQCNFCAQYFKEIYPKIDLNYIQPGIVRYVFKHIPNKTTHPEAFGLHEAAACAGDQEKYWEMHEQLFSHSGSQQKEDIVKYAGAIGLDLDRFETCLESGKHVAMIESDIAEAARGGVKVAPVLAIGLSGPDTASLKVMRVVVGTRSYDKFEEAIKAVQAASD